MKYKISRFSFVVMEVESEERMVDFIGTKFIAPSLGESAYNCPHCGAFSGQKETVIPFYIEKDGSFEPISEYVMSNNMKEEACIFIHRCYACEEMIIWLEDNMIYPKNSAMPTATEDMPTQVKKIYDEAREVFSSSPKAAAALLRLAIQYLCVELGEKGENINDDIASLMQKGLDVRVQKALDIVRVTGNNAVHPGTMDLSDDSKIAGKLFDLINYIVKRLITEPKEIDELFDELPNGAKKAIKKRDSKSENV